ncbi:MAG: phosphoribosylformimino-5-aminoimidazole carboxamide ribotide isomerase [Eubacterium sp.]|nr:phosphoribosylformimino-5-aminoimidazole carboxamide ribotide isomerase [Eubacterium sp.]
MKFRPCIDIHDGKVKQIVGGTLKDELGAETNFISEYDASFYGRLYANCKVPGGHIILLNEKGTPEYREDVRAASDAMKEYPGGFMIGGGVGADNAEEYLKLGASHVIVTSYVFKDGKIDFDRLNELTSLVGKDHIVLDLSARQLSKDGEIDYYIVTDRWQKFTDMKLCHETLDMLKEYSDEYLIHAVDVEGKKSGVDEKLLEMLGSWENGIPITYAGGVKDFNDLEKIETLGRGKIDATIGSALSIFGGEMDFDEVINYMGGSYEN